MAETGFDEKTFRAVITRLDGAIASELELPWRVCRGLAVMARAIGLVAHINEEMQEPLAAEIWSRIDDESSSHNRPSTD